MFLFVSKWPLSASFTIEWILYIPSPPGVRPISDWGHAIGVLLSHCIRRQSLPPRSVAIDRGTTYNNIIVVDQRSIRETRWSMQNRLDSARTILCVPWLNACFDNSIQLCTPLLWTHIHSIKHICTSNISHKIYAHSRRHMLGARSPRVNTAAVSRAIDRVDVVNARTHTHTHTHYRPTDPVVSLRGPSVVLMSRWWPRAAPRHCDYCNLRQLRLNSH